MRLDTIGAQLKTSVGALLGNVSPAPPSPANATSARGGAATTSPITDKLAQSQADATQFTEEELALDKLTKGLDQVEVEANKLRTTMAIERIRMLKVMAEVVRNSRDAKMAKAVADEAKEVSRNLKETARNVRDVGHYSKDMGAETAAELRLKLTGQVREATQQDVPAADTPYDEDDLEEVALTDGEKAEWTGLIGNLLRALKKIVEHAREGVSPLDHKGQKHYTETLKSLSADILEVDDITRGLGGTVEDDQSTGSAGPTLDISA